jgi:hypothetical protein
MLRVQCRSTVREILDEALIRDDTCGLFAGEMNVPHMASHVNDRSIARGLDSRTIWFW